MILSKSLFTSCILVAVWVANCASKSINKDGEKKFNALMPKHLLEHQTSYGFAAIQDHTAKNATHGPHHHCTSPGWHDTILNGFNNETHLRVGFCITYDPETDIASITLCPYFQPDVFHVIEYKGAHYVTLPENLSDINDFMCRPLNRKGRVCSECMDGYGPAVMSVGFNIQCSNCTSAWYEIPLFIFLEFFPITLFYFVILIFQINITSGSITCFIMFSQLLVISYDRIAGGDNFDINDIMLTATPTSKLLLKVLLTVYDIWNLRFFRYFLPPFCISSSLKPIHLVFVSYISVFYPLLLMVVNWAFVRLYDCNFTPLVCLCRPFLTNSCFVSLRRRWNPRNDIDSVFASFFLLSFTKVLFQLIFLLTYQRLRYVVYSSGEFLGLDWVVEFDLSVPYGGREQMIFAAISVLFFGILNLLPTLLLILYPFRFFQALLSRCRRVQIPVERFVRKFNSCYKDGLDGTGKDMRSFAGLYFVVRLTLFLVGGLGGALLISNNDPYLLRNVIFTITGVLVALCRPYRATYMNVLDTLLLAHLGMFCHLMSSYAGFQDRANFVIAFEVMVAIPFAGLLMVILVRVIRRVINSQAPRIMFRRCESLCHSVCLRNTHTSAAANDERVIQRTQIGISASDPHYGSINQLPSIAVSK